MRVLNAALAALLLLFAWLQANDPDAGLWVMIYGAGAFWTALAALRPQILALRPISMLLSLTAAVMLLGVFYFWPETPGWWQMAVWWETETAREGMGVMIVALSLLAPIAASVRAGRDRQTAVRRAKEQALERRRATALGAHRSLAEDL